MRSRTFNSNHSVNDALIVMVSWMIPATRQVIPLHCRCPAASLTNYDATQLRQIESPEGALPSIESARGVAASSGTPGATKEREEFLNRGAAPEAHETRYRDFDGRTQSVGSMICYGELRNCTTLAV